MYEELKKFSSDKLTHILMLYEIRKKEGKTNPLEDENIKIIREELLSRGLVTSGLHFIQ